MQIIHFCFLCLGQDGFYVSEAIHKAKIEVSEEGTKASAQQVPKRTVSATLRNAGLHLPFVRLIQCSLLSLSTKTPGPDVIRALKKKYRTVGKWEKRAIFKRICTMSP